MGQGASACKGYILALSYGPVHESDKNSAQVRWGTRRHAQANLHRLTQLPFTKRLPKLPDNCDGPQVFKLPGAVSSYVPMSLKKLFVHWGNKDRTSVMLHGVEFHIL